MNFLFPHKKAIGLDIGDSSIRAVSLSERGGNIFLNGCYMKELPDGYIKYGVVQKKAETLAVIAEVAGKVLAKGDLASFAVALPDSRTFMKFINLSSLTADEIHTRVIDEIRSNIPIELENSYFDYQVVFYNDQKLRYRGAILGIADKEIVKEYISLVEGIGYNVTHLEIEAPAVIRALFPIRDESYYQKFHVVLDIGESRSILLAYKGGVILFVLSIPITGYGMDNTIASSLDMDVKTARDARKKFGLNPNKANSNIRKVLLSEIEDVKKRIAQVEDFVKEHIAKQGKDTAGDGSSVSIIDKILITGSASDLPGLKEALDELMDIEVCVGDPLINLMVKDHSSLKQGELGSYTTAIGLALGLLIK